MQERWRTLPCFVTPVLLVYKGIRDRSVSMPRKMQCNGRITLRLTTGRHYGIPYACEFVMTLPSPPSPHDAPAESGWGIAGCVCGEQRVEGVPGMVVMLCPGMWRTACLKQRLSLMFCQKRGTEESSSGSFRHHGPGSHCCFSNVSCEWALSVPTSASTTKQGLEDVQPRGQGLCAE